MILVPAFNEEAAIYSVLQEIHGALPSVPVLVIDDCSTDATINEVKKANTPVLALPVHLGLGGSLQAGYQLAFDLGFDYVVRVDGDGQHDPNDIPRILEALYRGDCEMVIGSRFKSDEGTYSSLARRAGIILFRIFLRPILGRPVHDPTSGFVGVNRTALDLFSRAFPLEYPEIEALVVLQRKRFRFVEVPCRMRPRRAGTSSITTLGALKYVVHVLLGVFVNILRFERRRGSKYSDGSA